MIFEMLLNILNLLPQTYEETDFCGWLEIRQHFESTWPAFYILNT